MLTKRKTVKHKQIKMANGELTLFIMLWLKIDEKVLVFYYQTFYS